MNGKPKLIKVVGDVGGPYCSGRLPIEGESDLECQMPLLVEEWNYSKNRKLTPNMYKKNSSKVIFFACST